MLAALIAYPSRVIRTLEPLYTRCVFVTGGARRVSRPYEWFAYFRARASARASMFSAS